MVYGGYALCTHCSLCVWPPKHFDAVAALCVYCGRCAGSDAIEPKMSVLRTRRTSDCMCASTFSHSFFPNPISRSLFLFLFLFLQSLSLSCSAHPYFHYCFVYVVFECFHPTRVHLRSPMCQYNIHTTDWHQPNEIRRRYSCGCVVVVVAFVCS